MGEQDRWEFPERESNSEVSMSIVWGSMNMLKPVAELEWV